MRVLLSDGSGLRPGGTWNMLMHWRLPVRARSRRSTTPESQALIEFVPDRQVRAETLGDSYSPGRAP